MTRKFKSIEQRIIKRFYDRFMAAHEAFVQSIHGLPDEDARRRLASVIISRLMFIYFIQSKGFIKGENHPRARLLESKKRGKDCFYTEALRPPCLSNRLSLNRQIESSISNDIQIPDAAFERLFDLFDQYRWRLDEQPLGAEHEINPDVLGYILERHINKKQMGAYYTKEDITGYIGRNSIIPFIFDAARQMFKEPFEGERSVWRLLQENPDRYIHPSVKKGVELPLPGEIRACLGVASSCAESSRPAHTNYALPEEGWREVAARRKHYEQVRARLAGGEIRRINDLITFNLDAVRFAQDVIESCESAQLLAAFWQALEKITVLDPTCGSGAFIFAALKILEPLYAACLKRMQALLREQEQACGEHSSKELDCFRELLRREDKESGSNRRYFILKSIIANNLFGVDLMEEAVEICKLRLSLKLIAQLNPQDGAEPLLDFDFNIRAGNALVGFVSDRTLQLDVRANDEILNNRERLKEELNRRLAREYRIEQTKKKAYEEWLLSHKPFHWAIEFNEVIGNGGFDVIIGNPPYVSASKVQGEYGVRGYQTANCPDVYAWTLERASDLLKPGGRTGMIVPLNLSFSGDLDSCRDLLFKNYGENWFSSFGRIPAALFSFDVRVRNTIHIGHKTRKAAAQHTTRLHRWFESTRPHLFELLQYAPFTPDLWRNRVPKFSAHNLARAFERALSQTASTLAASFSSAPTPYALHFKKTAYNWLNFCRALPPCYDSNGASVPHTKFGSVYFEDAVTRDLAFVLLNGKLAFAFWCVVGDDFDVTRWMFADFPINLRSLQDSASARLLPLTQEMEDLMMKNLSFKLNAGRRVGNYNLAKCREVTDKSDRIIAEHMGFENAWADIELVYEQIVKTDFNSHNEI
jgi:hypothetical protein